MSCADGTGMFVGMTVESDWKGRKSGDSGEMISEAQALIRAHDAAISPVADTILRIRSADEWMPEQTIFDSTRTDDGEGAYARKRKGCTKSNPPWTCDVEYNGDDPIELLIGCYGEIRRTNPDGSYREAHGWCTAARVMPSQVPDEESVGQLTFQWEGGGEDDAGHVKFFRADGSQEYPVNAAPPV